ARVREQVHEHLRQALLVAANDGHAGPELHIDALAALLEERLDELARREHDLVEQHLLTADRELPRLDAHALEQVVDEPREPLRAALQRRDELTLRARLHLADAVLQELDRRELRGERRAELVRNVREHRVARAAHGLELRFVAQHLHLQAVRGGCACDDDAPRAAFDRRNALDRVRRADAPRANDRARELARPPALRVALGLQHVAAKLPERLLGRHLEQLLGLRIDEADAARVVDGVDAFDDAAQDGLRLRFAQAQLARELDQVATHLVHRLAEARELLAAADRNRGREVARRETLRGV